jgi:hypothetical protein
MYDPFNEARLSFDMLSDDEWQAALKCYKLAAAAADAAVVTGKRGEADLLAGLIHRSAKQFDVAKMSFQTAQAKKFGAFVFHACSSVFKILTSTSSALNVFPFETCYLKTAPVTSTRSHPLLNLTFRSFFSLYNMSQMRRVRASS